MPEFAAFTINHVVDDLIAVIQQGVTNEVRDKFD